MCIAGASEMLNVCELCLDRLKGILHPFNMYHVKLLDRAFDACIDLGSWTKAVHYGSQLTDLYQ